MQLTLTGNRTRNVSVRKTLWTEEMRLRGKGKDGEIETQISNAHVCKLHRWLSVQFYFTTVHVKV